MWRTVWVDAGPNEDLVESFLVCDCLLEDMKRERKRASAFLLFYILSSSCRKLRDSIAWVRRG